MRYRRLGKTSYKVSEIGGRPRGADLEVLHAAVDLGVTFFMADDEEGERLLARLARERSEELVLAASVEGPPGPDAYTRAALRAWVGACRARLEVDRLDLFQVRRPPTDVYYRPEVFEALDVLVAEGAVASYGLAVERVEEGLKAVEYPGVACLEVVFNIFRQRPAERLLAAAAERDVGVVVRDPLAAGLLAEEPGGPAAVELGTGLDPETGAQAAAQLHQQVPPGATLAQLALRWILMHDQVSTVTPDATTVEQVRSFAAASGLEALSEDTMHAIAWVYSERVAPLVHQRW